MDIFFLKILKNKGDKKKKKNILVPTWILQPTGSRCSHFRKFWGILCFYDPVSVGSQVAPHTKVKFEQINEMRSQNQQCVNEIHTRMGLLL